MGRSIIKTKPGSLQQITKSKNETENDSYVNQIIKLIPVDIVGVYLGITKLLSTWEESYPIIQTSIFLIILIITPFYLKRADSQIDIRHIVVSTISFAVWAFSLGDPFEKFLKLGHDKFQIMSSVVIMIYTLIVPLLYKKPE